MQCLAWKVLSNWVRMYQNNQIDEFMCTRRWDSAYAALVLGPALIGQGFSMLTTLLPASLRVQCPLNLPRILIFVSFFFLRLLFF